MGAGVAGMRRKARMKVRQTTRIARPSQENRMQCTGPGPFRPAPNCKSALRTIVALPNAPAVGPSVRRRAGTPVADHNRDSHEVILIPEALPRIVNAG